ncbi:MAG: response regulator RpfG family c-di-GMP phosphodiesterase [Bacteriovoracaceae bacterium]|jgi:response regulator RpfG family c-di-GMP phosphodiesterase
MSQAILISKNEVINSLYEVNLRAYVATNVTIKKNLESAKELIEHSPNIDAIICFAENKKKQMALQEFEQFLSEKNLNIPILILGDSTVSIANSIHITNRYDIKSILQAMAKILEVGAKEMASMQVPKFFPIPLKLFSQIDSSHCDIFFRSSKDDFEYDYFQILEKDIPIGDTLQKYIHEGVEHLYIDANERLRFINRTSKAVVGELERSDLTSEERIEITQQGMGIVAEDVFESNQISQEVAEVSKACIESINKVCVEIPSIKNLLDMLLENPSDYCYKHSVLTTYIANKIIGKISWGSSEQQNKVAFSLFFHDIYLVPIYRRHPDAIVEEDLLFMDDVSDEDKQIVIDHAKMAGDLVKTFPRCPMGADMIISQHHGMTSGQGFAVNFKDDISPLSKIMIIAEDIGTGLLVNQNENGKVTINKKTITKRLTEKYRNHTYRKVIEAFNETKL